MSSLAKDTRASVIPCFRYRNAPAAIEWLCATFGFEKHLVVPNDDGTVAHVQLSFGNGMIMFRRPGRGVDFGTRQTTIQCRHPRSSSRPRGGRDEVLVLDLP
jgi:hypothetical protein